MINLALQVGVDLSRFAKYVNDMDKEYSVDVGVLGNEVNSKGGSVAEYGACHEFGSVENNLPRRSFILDPLQNHLNDEIKAFESVLINKLENGETEKALEIVGMKGVEIVKKAFDTENDGTWAPLAPSTIERMSEERQKGWKILTDTGALVKSITHKVVRND